MRDHRDFVVEDLANSEAALIDRIVDLECERDSYRALAQQLLHGLHKVLLERDLLRDQRVLDRRRNRDERRAA